MCREWSVIFFHCTPLRMSNGIALNGCARLKSLGSIWGAPILVLTNRKYLPIVNKRGALDRLGRSNRARPVIKWVICKGDHSLQQWKMFQELNEKRLVQNPHNHELPSTFPVKLAHFKTQSFPCKCIIEVWNNSE